MADTLAEPKTEATGQTAKDQVRALLDRLPDGLTLEQLQYHLSVYVTLEESPQAEYIAS